MRLLILHHPDRLSERLRDVAEHHGARNFSSMDARDPGTVVTLLSLPNAAFESFAADVEPFRDLGVVLIPHDVMSIPAGRGPDEQTSRVTPKSASEVYLEALKDVGNWTAYSAYAAISGALAWSGLYTNTVYLLVAAMLVAPYPDPLLNTAIATARGHAGLLLRSVVRYFVALLIGAGVAFGLTALFQVERAGSLATAVAALSDAALLLPLAAGVVGALYLTSSEKSSLVSAAAAGVLVAAAISPPLAIVGISAWTGEWALFVRSVFLLLLQIAGINLAAAAVFRLRGLSTRGPWYSEGSPRAAVAGAVATVLLFGALLAWQFSSPDFQRGSRAAEAVAVARAEVSAVPETDWLTGDATIYGEGEAAVLVATVTARWTGLPEEIDEADRELTRLISSVLARRGFPEPLVDVSLLQ